MRISYDSTDLNAPLHRLIFAGRNVEILGNMVVPEHQEVVLGSGSVRSTGSFTNRGKTVVAFNGMLWQPGPSDPGRPETDLSVENFGLFVISSDISSLRSFKQEAPGITQVDARLSLAPSRGSIQFDGGLVTGNGTIDVVEAAGGTLGTVVNRGACIAPGLRPVAGIRRDSEETCGTKADVNGQLYYDVTVTTPPFDGTTRIGELRISGNYEQRYDGQLAIDCTRENADCLTISGTAHLDGGLAVRCYRSDDGPTRSLRVLHADGGIVGAFRWVTEGFTAQYLPVERPTDVYLVPLRTGDFAVNRLGQGLRVDGSDEPWRYEACGERRCAGWLIRCAGCEPPAGALDCRGSNDSDGWYSMSCRGCVLTCATMVTNALLERSETPLTLLAVGASSPDGPTILENRDRIPGTTCRLKTNAANWSYLPEVLRNYSAEQRFTWKVRSDFGPSECFADERLAWENLIAGYIWSGVPVAVRVGRNDVATHTVVAWKVILEDGVRRIRIADPKTRSVDGQFVTNEFLSDYPIISKVDVIYPSPDSSTRYRISAGSPVEFLLTDGLGRRTGFDPATRSMLHEIPNVSYAADWPDDAEFSGDPSIPIPSRDAAHKSLYLDVAPGTALTFEYFGTNNGNTVIRFEMTGGEGSAQTLLEMPVTLSPDAYGSLDVSTPDANGNGGGQVWDAPPPSTSPGSTGSTTPGDGTSSSPSPETSGNASGDNPTGGTGVAETQQGQQTVANSSTSPPPGEGSADPPADAVPAAEGSLAGTAARGACGGASAVLILLCVLGIVRIGRCPTRLTRASTDRRHTDRN
ncbi:MAG: hypothetical protein U1D55_02550 [Phycisphaerae bacterium]